MKHAQFKIFVTFHDSGEVRPVWVSAEAVSCPLIARGELDARHNISGDQFWDACDEHGGWITGSEI